MASAIVDASVAVKWFMREPDSHLARAFGASATVMLAPEFLVLEVANALRKAVATGAVSRDYAEQSIAIARRIFDPLIETDSLINKAFTSSLTLRHPIYDCLYLAAAERLDLPLITADAAFVAKLAGTPFAQRVVLLADWKP